MPEISTGHHHPLRAKADASLSEPPCSGATLKQKDELMAQIELEGRVVVFDDALLEIVLARRWSIFELSLIHI